VSWVIAEGKRTKAYADYVQRCKERGITPTSFRTFAETTDEYDREWEIANYRYEHRDEREVKGGNR
jgi:hypothetical protein